MALRSRSSTGFTDLPRELRDIICKEIASAAGIRVKLFSHYKMDLADEEYAGCLQMLYDWSPKSLLAQTVYDEILVGAQFERQWVLEPGSIVWSTMPLIMQGYGPIEKMKISPRSTIDLQYCVRDIDLDIKYYRLNDSYERECDLSSVEFGLAQLSQLPNLRRVKLTVWIHAYIDAYHGPMRLFGSISSAVKQVKKQVGDNLSVSIRRNPTDTLSIFIDSHDISWMWDPPSCTSEENAGTNLVAVEKRIKGLIADRAHPHGPSRLVEDLRDAVGRLPQDKHDIVRMDDWSVGTGITKEKWLKIRGT